MDPSALEDMIREAVQRAMDERISHPSQRAKMTKFQTPEGQTWISTTLERGEMLRKAAVILAVVVGSTVGLVQFTNRWFLIPTIDERAHVQIVDHEDRVRDEMKKTIPEFVTKAEFNARVAAADQKWSNQAEFNERVEAALVTIQADIKEILKRVR